MSKKIRFVMARRFPASCASWASWAAAALLSLGVWSCGGSAQEPPKSASEKPPQPAGSAAPAPAPAHSASASNANGIEVLLCDGKTTTVVPEGTPGTAIAGSLMAQWLRKNPNSNWEAEEKERHKPMPAADNTKLITPAPVLTGQAQTYGRVTEQDVALWKAESERLATAGSRVFHNADELGSTIAVSCDMCHPHAANTHPETYPKFQAQLGRVALLRDMINWCLEHPVRAKPMSSDDPRMRAMEAYIYAQRKGKALDYGRH